MNSVVLVESQGSCALVRIVRLQKFDRRDNMIFTLHLNRLIDENTPLEQSTIETCLLEAYKYQKVTKISCDIGSRFEASWLDCVTMMSEMTIAVIVVSASCHHLTRADSGWSRISWFSRVTLPWLRGGTSVAPWRHKCSHVPVFRRLFDRLPVRISTSDLHHRILRNKLYHIRAYDFGVQFSFKINTLSLRWRPRASCTNCKQFHCAKWQSRKAEGEGEGKRIERRQRFAHWASSGLYIQYTLFQMKWQSRMTKVWRQRKRERERERERERKREWVGVRIDTFLTFSKIPSFTSCLKVSFFFLKSE